MNQKSCVLRDPLAEKAHAPPWIHCGKQIFEPPQQTVERQHRSHQEAEEFLEQLFDEREMRGELVEEKQRVEKRDG